MMNIASLLAYCIRNYMRTCYVFAALALSGLSFNVQASKVIDVWTYYSSPPFSLSSDQHSLTQVLFRELSSRSEGRWTFKVSYLPRKRINLNLGKDRQGIVVWTNPLWFNDKEESKYSWTNRVVWGRNEIVSLKGTPVEYEGAKSLIGKRFGGVLGHHYVEIDDYVKNNDILRLNTNSFSQNFTKLLKKRLDVIIIPRSELYFMASKSDIQNNLYISKKPHQIYPRKFLVTKELIEVRDFLNEEIPKIQNSDFITLLNRYGLER